MKVLMISTDRNSFKLGSATRMRMEEYGTLAEIFIIVFSKKSLNLQAENISSTVHLYPTNSITRWGYIFDALKLGSQIMRQNSIEVITAQDPFETGIVTWWLARKFKKKFQIQIHTDFLSPFFKNSLLQKMRVLMAKFLLPRADSVRVVSERIKGVLTNWKLKTEPVVLPIFVDPSRFMEGPHQDDLHERYPQFSFIVLMISRLSVEKNIQLAIDAIGEVRHQHQKVGLVIVGDGPLKESLKQYTLAKGLKDTVVFESWKEEVAGYYKTADLFLLTSLYEGFGLTLVEASLSGCPVVSTDVGIAPLLYPEERDKYVCPVGDMWCVAEKILYSINNLHFRQKFSLNAKHLLERQNFITTKDVYLKKYVGLWEKLAA